MSASSTASSLQGFPLSPQQRSIWVQAQASGRDSRDRVCVRTTRTLEPERLRRAAARLIDRHEMLRTRFERMAGVEFPVQVVDGFRGEPAPAGTVESVDALTLIDVPALRLDARVFDAASGTELDIASDPLAFDRGSHRALLEELMACYEADGAEALPETIPYSVVAEWMGVMLEAEDMAEGRHFWAEWRKTDAGAPTLRVTSDPRRIGTVDAWVANDRAAAVRDAAAAQGVSVKAVFLAAWAALLHRQQGGSAPIWVAFDGREERLRDVLGVIERPLPVAPGVSGDQLFVDVVRRLEQTLLEYQQWQYFFDPAIAISRPAGAAEPAFEYVATPPAAAGSGGGYFETTEECYGPRAAGWTLVVAEERGGMRLSLTFDPAATSEAAARRVLRRFETLLADACIRQSATVADLNLLPAEEDIEIRRHGSGPRRDYGPVKTLAALFEERAVLQPDAIAVHADGQAFSYADVAARVRALATRLAAEGVGRGSVVGLATSRSVHLIVGIVAVSHVGGAYVPILPSYPRERVAFILENAGAALVLSERCVAAALPSVKVLYLDDPETAAVPGTCPQQVGEPGEVAYIIYTSGSTGRPKGVSITHANVFNLIGWLRELVYDGLPANSPCALIAPAAFDASVQQIFPTLATGHALHVVPESVRTDGAELAKFLFEHRIVLCDGTPTHLRFLAAEIGAYRGQLALQYLLIGGEALPIAIARSFLAHFRDVVAPQIVNVYGPTECTVDSTYLPLSELPESASGIVPLGRPIPNVTALVLDEAGRLCPFGVSGELHLAGAGVGRGYVAAPELTDARFLAGPDDGAMLYKTGDLVALGDDGRLLFFGRIDSQVKIRGLRIELEEIETVLLEQPGITGAAVDVRTDPSGEDFLVAFLVVSAAVSTRVLVAALARKLPSYMLPRHYSFVEKLPLTANAKIDRKALRLLQEAQSAKEVAYVPPQGPMEEKLAAIWSEVLKVARIGRNDNFFTLGGDSIRSIQVRARAHKAGVTFNLIDLFKHPTIASLAAVAGTATEAQPAVAPFSQLKPADRTALPEGLDDAYPMTRLQIGMMYHNQYGDRTAAYHDVASVHVEMEFHAAKFEQALTAVAARHPVLRTSFRPHGFSEPLQLVHTEARVPLEIHDLCGGTTHEQESQITAWIDRDRARGFDVAQAPLYRVAVHRRSESTVQVSYSNHHAILDGWSVAVLIAELFQRYLADLAGGTVEEDSAAPKSTASFSAYVAEERRLVASAGMAEFWRRELEGAEVVKLKPDLTAASMLGTQEIDLNADVTGNLLRLAREAEVPLKSAFLAVHAAVVRSLSELGQPVTGLVTNGRPEEEGGDRVLGLFLNTVPFRIPTGRETWRSLAKKVYEKEVSLAAARRYPLFDIRNAAGFKAPLSVTFNYISFHVLLGLAETNLKVLSHHAHEESSIDLVVNAIYSEALREAKIVLRFNRRQVAATLIDSVATRFAAAAAAAADPDAPAECGAPVVPQPSQHERARQNLAVGDYEEPRTEVEQKLAAIWSRLLRVKSVGANDNFFELGGESLKAVTALSEIEAAFQRRIRIADFATCSLRELAGKLEPASAAGPT